jgi:glycosyltransferase involved in cell wall biosynthesis
MHADRGLFRGRDGLERAGVAVRKGPRAVRPKSALPIGLSDALITAAFGVGIVVVWVLLVIRLGWVGGFFAGWIVAPVTGVASALLMAVWTIPLRNEDVLSFKRRRRHFEPDASAPARRKSISVVMPVYNGEPYLRISLPPLIAMLADGALAEVLLIDDGSTDASAAYARELGATVIGSGGCMGPGAARNLAIANARGEILWFVDADVVVHPGSAHYIQSAFCAPNVVAVFGSYDDRPAAPNFGSQYKNLVHHHYHQHADIDASTFWSGCGAVDKAAFAEVGGFDAETFRMPSVEDVDLGYKLRQAGGAIRLDRRLLSTHLKVWSVTELVRTDIFRRAIPWARMMLQRSEILDDLNVGTFERLRALLAALLIFVTIAAVAGWISPWWLAPMLLTILTANWHLFRLFYRRRGLLFAVAGLLFHQVYYLYSAAAFVGCWLEFRLSGRSARTAEAA